MGLQAQGGAGTGLGPATESALREPFLATPVALAVIRQALNGVATPRPENKQRPGLRIATQCLTAQRGQTIDTTAEVDRFDGQQDPHLRSDLDHARLQNA